MRQNFNENSVISIKPENLSNFKTSIARNVEEVSD
jgi:hypothetical protein